MKIRQISLFIENRAGQLLEITQLFAKNNIDLKAINISETSDYGVLKIITDEPDRALKLLSDNEYVTGINHVVAVSVPNRPGGLSQLLETVSNAGINIEYMYSVFGQQEGMAYMIMKVNDPDKLIEVIDAAEELKTANINDLKID
ncbi:MAG: ACT domain-containing protein [Ruminococcus sp.]|nr:ACT domain-containing protein [Candidatus Copronaster equi]